MTEEKKEEDRWAPLDPVKHESLGAALVAAQREVRGGPAADGTYEAKTSKYSNNPGASVSFDYPKAETSVPWMRRILNRHGLAIMPGSELGSTAPVPVPGSNDVVVPFDYCLMHESGEFRHFTAWVPVCTPYGKTLTAGWKVSSTGTLKYVYMDVLGVRTSEDDDEAGGHRPAARKAEEGPPPPRPPSAPKQEAPAAPPPPRAKEAAPAAPPPAPAAAAPPSTAATPTATTGTTPAAPSPSDGGPKIADVMAEEFERLENDNREKRVARIQAAAKATGMPGKALYQYVMESVLVGEDVDLSDPAPAHANKIEAALKSLAALPLPAEEVAALVRRREDVLAMEAAVSDPPAPAGATTTGGASSASALAASNPASAAPPAVATSRATTASPTTAASTSPPRPPAAKATAATDVRLAGRLASFMKAASEHRKSLGVQNATQEYLDRVSGWAMIPGFAAAGRDFEREIKPDVTSEVMDRLEAGLAAWKAERQTAEVRS